MPFNFLFKHSYASLEKDELEVVPQNISVGSWTNYQVPLPVVISAIGLQFLIWCATIFYFLNVGNPTLVVPIDANLHDSFGNYYPAAAAIKYETLVFQVNKTFMSMAGIPSIETDEAWTEMQEPGDGVIQASYQDGFEVDNLPETITSKIDSTQHMYGLEVFHQLHCLDRIRKSFYSEHYFPNDTERSIIFHREHCIEHLRHSIMCSGDFTLDRWEYDEETRRNWLKTDVPHVCRNFGDMKTWVEKYKYRVDSWERRVDSSLQR